jgi:hypothetical protein
MKLLLNSFDKFTHVFRSEPRTTSIDVHFDAVGEDHMTPYLDRSGSILRDGRGRTGS